MKLFIITGASKGLGRALAAQALENDNRVISISRTNTINHPLHLHLKHDFSQNAALSSLEAKLKLALKKTDLKKIDSIHLINNAAALEPIGPLEKQKPKDIQSHLQINLFFPIYLSQLFITFFKTKKKNIPRTITNISSAAAFRPIEGWALYCSSKSGLKMFSECLQLEVAHLPSPFKVLSFSPGVMDTDMQKTIRQQSPKKFSRVEEFKQLKQKNLLQSTDKIARDLHGLLEAILKNPEAYSKTHYESGDL